MFTAERPSYAPASASVMSSSATVGTQTRPSFAPAGAAGGEAHWRWVRAARGVATLRIRDCRSESRYLVFQCLQHTIGLPPEQWRILDQPHGRRVESLLARTLPFVVWSGMGSVGHSMVVIHQNSEFRAAFRGLCRIGCHSRFS